MNFILENQNNDYDNYDKAIILACEKFEEKHPKDSQPSWLKYCMAMNITRNQNRNWVIKMILRPKAQLGPDLHWEWNDDGIPMLINVDSITKKRSMVICGGPAEDIEVFFEVEVDFNKGLLIQLDTDLNMLDRSKYDINRR